MRIVLTTLFILLFSHAFGQPDVVRTQAEQMGKTLLQKNYKAFVTYSFPAILDQMGGPEKMATSIARQMSSMESAGAKLIGFTYGQPSAIIQEGKELQCTIPQQMIVQTSAGKIASNSTLIAISRDNGRRWYFVDAGERDIATVRKSLPNISKAINIPKPGAPQLIK